MVVVRLPQVVHPTVEKLTLNQFAVRD